ncbi:hypothetical protein ELH42_37800 [Rhizobium ruizarguesonis]|uniref:hypothetical protein n=1 Tax=Rhizobium ruizarguesonis TaxID=2081791 RepID=UPI001031DD53|nr:hypothetical protein [Rhizobium ruizarguesonis]TBB57032.1 hypothetical protein ELH42_37800 [Rhizobium ruizarguesonis]
MRFEALNKLWNNVRESSHDFRASTEIFPALDTEKLAQTLEVREKGAENGAASRPAASAQSLDEIEQRIAGRVEQEKAASYQILEDQFQTFEGRLRNLDFEGQFGLIRQANASSLSDFKAEIASGVDELHGLRRDLKIAEDEMTSFKRDHRLDRAAKVPSAGATSVKVALLVVLVLIEVVMNGNFLAKGSEQGIVGGITEAIVFAVLNIGAAILFAFFCVRNLVHRSWLLKLGGLVGLVLYVAVALAVNLALAHYREVSATILEGAGTEVIRRIRENPWGLVELNSWMLLAIGLFFSILAFIDGCVLTDPYPGFAGVQKRLDAARDHYIGGKQDLIDNLREIRDEHNEKIEDIVRDLSSRRQESSAIIAHRTRTIGLFAEYQSQLERTANALLTIYRDANRTARTEPEPQYFATPYKLERLTPVTKTSEEWDDRVLSERTQVAQTELNEQIRKIGSEFESAVEQYHRLDKLFPEAGVGTEQAA